MALSFAAFAPLPGSAAIARSQPDTATACADFLAQMHKKPAHVQFIRCIYEPERQGKPLRAIYSVSGTYAARTEAWLIKTVGLNRLKRSCCQWDSAAAQFKSAQGRDFAIAMVSDETGVDKRTQWHKIPRFEIIVETLTEDI
jgi:hypothetical protein